jgi:Trk K+ transport system NAD-binding subunit
MKNHVVIIGFGNKGLNVMEESLRNKEKVLVVESDPHNSNLALAKPPACRFFIGDSGNRITLKKAGIQKAKSVFLLMGDDARQVKACILIYQLIRESARD